MPRPFFDINASRRAHPTWWSPGAMRFFSTRVNECSERLVTVDGSTACACTRQPTPRRSETWAPTLPAPGPSPPATVSPTLTTGLLLFVRRRADTMFKEWIQVTATRDGFRDYRAQVGNIESALSGFVEPAAETARNRWQWSVGTIDGPYFGRIGEAYSEERAKAEACEAAIDLARSGGLPGRKDYRCPACLGGVIQPGGCGHAECKDCGARWIPVDQVRRK